EQGAATHRRCYISYIRVLHLLADGVSLMTSAAGGGSRGDGSLGISFALPPELAQKVREAEGRDQAITQGRGSFSQVEEGSLLFLKAGSDRMAQLKEAGGGALGSPGTVEGITAGEQEMAGERAGALTQLRGGQEEGLKSGIDLGQRGSSHSAVVAQEELPILECWEDFQEEEEEAAGSLGDPGEGRGALGGPGVEEG
ncbi:unnamed protein product, partial [Discosporangium mesarthrocarpum]